MTTQQAIQIIKDYQSWVIAKNGNKSRPEGVDEAMNVLISVAEGVDRELAMGILYLNECAVESGNELDYEIEKSVFEDVVGLVSS